MSTSDALSKLSDLHDKGVLSDEEFARAKSRLLDSGSCPCAEAPAVAAINGLRRSLNDRWLGGVCGGIARSTGIASWVWRLMFVLLFLLGGSGGLFYVLMWIFVPLESAAPRDMSDATHAR